MIGRSSLPSSLYRLQLNREMPFARVRALLPYLEALGVEGLYLSPILAARSGSRHGYDGVDPTRLWADLGTEADWQSLAGAARARGLGLVADIVPNHLATSDENAAWWEVLRFGPAATTAPWFDIDWQPHPVTGRPCVVLAVLPAPLPEALRDGGVALHWEGADPVFRTRDGARFPLAPETEAEARALRAEPGRPEDGLVARRLHLLDLQHYRLVPYGEGHRSVNYRRFFQVNDLIGLRVEDPAVFEAVHRRILDWVARGDLVGLRVDHIDGLLEPRRYLERLRAAITARSRGPFAIWVEKILLGNEPLRPTWPIEGSTGYDALARLTRLFVDPAALAELGRTYRESVPTADPPERTIERSKRETLEEYFPADLDRLVRIGLRPAPGSLPVPPPDKLRAELRELAADFDVYRTYVESTGPIDPWDGEVWHRAFDRAAGGGIATETLRRWWTDWSERSEVPRELLLRFQQLTVPVMAKGVEDRALYRELLLTALNEVGIPPGPVEDDPVKAFHRDAAERARRWPRSMVTTSTHDTKRSEDVRARLLALAQEPAGWDRLARQWQGAPGVPALPAGSDAAFYLLFQTVVGTWPVDGVPTDRYRSRLRAYGEKALREAGWVTRWDRPDRAWEQAILDRVDAVVQHDAPFRRVLAETRPIWGFGGALLSLVQVTLKLTGPGVPDVYQGTELWDDSLVDPDNRRPVDWVVRESELRRLSPWIDGEQPPIPELLRHWPDGRVKLWLTSRLLRRRRRDPARWVDGAYRPWPPAGWVASPVVAFLRGSESEGSLVVAARLLPGLLQTPRREGLWEPRADLGRLVLPGRSPDWIDRISGRRWSLGSDHAVPISDLLGGFPAAILEPTGSGPGRVSGRGAGGSSRPGS